MASEGSTGKSGSGAGRPRRAASEKIRLEGMQEGGEASHYVSEATKSAKGRTSSSTMRVPDAIEDMERQDLRQSGNKRWNDIKQEADGAAETITPAPLKEPSRSSKRRQKGAGNITADAPSAHGLSKHTGLADEWHDSGSREQSHSAVSTRRVYEGSIGQEYSDRSAGEDYKQEQSGRALADLKSSKKERLERRERGEKGGKVERAERHQKGKHAGEPAHTELVYDGRTGVSPVTKNEETGNGGGGDDSLNQTKGFPGSFNADSGDAEALGFQRKPKESRRGRATEICPRGSSDQQGLGISGIAVPVESGAPSKSKHRKKEATDVAKCEPVQMSGEKIDGSFGRAQEDSSGVAAEGPSLAEEKADPPSRHLSKGRRRWDNRQELESGQGADIASDRGVPEPQALEGQAAFSTVAEQTQPVGEAGWERERRQDGEAERGRRTEKREKGRKHDRKRRGGDRSEGEGMERLDATGVPAKSHTKEGQGWDNLGQDETVGEPWGKTEQSKDGPLGEIGGDELGFDQEGQDYDPFQAERSEGWGGTQEGGNGRQRKEGLPATEDLPIGSQAPRQEPVSGDGKGRRREQNQDASLEPNHRTDKQARQAKRHTAEFDDDGEQTDEPGRGRGGRREKERDIHRERESDRVRSKARSREREEGRAGEEQQDWRGGGGGDGEESNRGSGREPRWSKRSEAEGDAARRGGALGGVEWAPPPQVRNVDLERELENRIRNRRRDEGREYSKGRRDADLSRSGRSRRGSQHGDRDWYDGREYREEWDERSREGRGRVGKGRGERHREEGPEGREDEEVRPGRRDREGKQTGRRRTTDERTRSRSADRNGEEKDLQGLDGGMERQRDVSGNAGRERERLKVRPARAKGWEAEDDFPPGSELDGAENHREEEDRHGEYRTKHSEKAEQQRQRGRQWEEMEPGDWGQGMEEERRDQAPRGGYAVREEQVEWMREEGQRPRRPRERRTAADRDLGRPPGRHSGYPDGPVEPERGKRMRGPCPGNEEWEYSLQGGRDEWVHDLAAPEQQEWRRPGKEEAAWHEEGLEESGKGPERGRKGCQRAPSGDGASPPRKLRRRSISPAGMDAGRGPQRLRPARGDGVEGSVSSSTVSQRRAAAGAAVFEQGSGQGRRRSSAADLAEEGPPGDLDEGPPRRGGGERWRGESMSPPWRGWAGPAHAAFSPDKPPRSLPPPRGLKSSSHKEERRRTAGTPPGGEGPLHGELSGEEAVEERKRMGRGGSLLPRPQRGRSKGDSAVMGPPLEEEGGEAGRGTRLAGPPLRPPMLGPGEPWRGGPPGMASWRSPGGPRGAGMGPGAEFAPFPGFGPGPGPGPAGFQGMAQQFPPPIMFGPGRGGPTDMPFGGGRGFKGPGRGLGEGGERFGAPGRGPSWRGHGRGQMEGGPPGGMRAGASGEAWEQPDGPRGRSEWERGGAPMGRLWEQWDGRGRGGGEPGPAAGSFPGWEVGGPPGWPQGRDVPRELGAEGARGGAAAPKPRLVDSPGAPPSRPADEVPAGRQQKAGPVDAPTTAKREVGGPAAALPAAEPKSSRAAMASLAALVARLPLSQELAGPALVEQYEALLPRSDLQMLSTCTAMAWQLSADDGEGEDAPAGQAPLVLAAEEALSELGPPGADALLLPALAEGAFEASLALYEKQEAEGSWRQKSAVGSFWLPFAPPAPDPAENQDVFPSQGADGPVEEQRPAAPENIGTGGGNGGGGDKASAADEGQEEKTAAVAIPGSGSAAPAGEQPSSAAASGSEGGGRADAAERGGKEAAKGQGSSGPPLEQAALGVQEEEDAYEEEVDYEPAPGEDDYDGDAHNDPLQGGFSGALLSSHWSDWQAMSRQRAVEGGIRGAGQLSGMVGRQAGAGGHSGRQEGMAGGEADTLPLPSAGSALLVQDPTKAVADRPLTGTKDGTQPSMQASQAGQVEAGSAGAARAEVPIKTGPTRRREGTSAGEPELERGAKPTDSKQGRGKTLVTASGDHGETEGGAVEEALKVSQHGARQDGSMEKVVNGAGGREAQREEREEEGVALALDMESVGVEVADAGKEMGDEANRKWPQTESNSLQEADSLGGKNVMSTKSLLKKTGKKRKNSSTRDGDSCSEPGLVAQEGREKSLGSLQGRDKRREALQ